MRKVSAANHRSIIRTCTLRSFEIVEFIFESRQYCKLYYNGDDVFAIGILTAQDHYAFKHIKYEIQFL